MNTSNSFNASASANQSSTAATGNSTPTEPAAISNSTSASSNSNSAFASSKNTSTIIHPNATNTPFFLDRDPESSAAAAKRRSLVRAGGTASSPDLRTLVYKKAKDLAQAAGTGTNAAAATGNGTGTTSGGTTSNGAPNPSAATNGSGSGAGPVPFPSARSGNVGGGGSGRPSRDEEYEARYGSPRPGTATGNNGTGLSSSQSASNAAAAAAGSVSLADELAMHSPSMFTDDKGTVKGGAFKERMKKTSGFLRRLRGGGGAAAAAAAEPMPVAQGVGLGVSTGNATLRPAKPVPPLPMEYTSQLSAATRSASYTGLSAELGASAGASGTATGSSSTVTTPRTERELPVPPRPPRRSSRGGGPITLSGVAGSGSSSTPPSPVRASGSQSNFPAAQNHGGGGVSPAQKNLPSLGGHPANARAGPPSSYHVHTHKANYSIDPELDPDVAHFADRAWGDDDLPTARQAAGNADTIKASSGVVGLSTTVRTTSPTPNGTPISTRFATQSSSSTSASGTTLAPSLSNPVLQQQQQRRSFSPTLASPTESAGFGGGATSTSSGGINPLFVNAPIGISASGSSRKMSEGEQSLKLGESDATAMAEKAWNEQDQFARKEKIAEWLGTDALLNRATCAAYFKHFDFSNMRVDVAFRRLCDKLFLRAETQQVDRILSAFSQRYWECNPSSVYGSADIVHSVVFSLLLLNTDLHVADIQDRMTRQQFVRNTIAAIQESTGMDGSSAGPSSASGSIYGHAGAAASASGVVGGSGTSPRPPHTSLGAESSTSLGRLSADARNESSEFVGNFGAMALGVGSSSASASASASATAAGASLSPTLTPARPTRRGSVRSYQGFFRSGANSSLGNVAGSDRDDGASIASGERPAGYASPPSTSRGQYPPPAGLNAPSVRQRSRSGSGTTSLVEVQSAINSRMWLVDLEAQLKDIYNTVKSDQIRLPMYDSRATLTPSFTRRGMRNLTVGGPGTGRVNALKRGSIRGIQGLLGSSTTINSEGTTSPVSSMASRSFLDSSPHTPATSLASSTASQPLAALGFASTLSQSIIKEAQDEDVTPSGGSINDEIDDDDLALMGPPWAKEGFITRKHYYEGPHKRSKEKTWVEVFVVVQKGMLNMFQFNSNPSATIKARSGPHANDSAVVGGGNWLSNATALGDFPLAHTLANALPPPGYNRARPHVFALTLPGGIVYLFQAGHEDLVQEWVATCNYWAARQSREPLAGGVSNMEYGWNKVLPRDFDDGIDDSASLSLSLTNGNAGASSFDPSALYATNSARPADSRSIRSGRSARSFRQRAGAALYQNWHDAANLVAPTDSLRDGGLRSPAPSVLGAGQSPIHVNERIYINEWKAPEAPMVASLLSEEKQLERCTRHMQSIETDLTAHNELRQPMLQLYSPRGSNYAKALANWERKSNHLLQELVKYQCYVESLKNAMRLRAEKHDLKEVDKMLATADEELKLPS
ncbi:hypothetical protein A4X13_0g1831 [Tilletia indica]|uniref:Uncharacterized protein n=1 Tax=Tilletia indica TaxID=43049 RepID=A0A177TPC7_9BASI|nr:hypothetical protein A4X13_0g1831 [Tilletia indica]